MKKIKVFIVDDETLARKRVRHMLESYPHISVIKEFKNGLDTYRHLLTFKPDLIFLDIQMPEMSGIEFVETLGIHNLPPIIFVTAYDDYAVKAFEFHAVDYLLKPFDKKRFNEAFTRAIERINNESRKTYNDKIQEVIQQQRLQNQKKTRLFIKHDGFIQPVDFSLIDYISAAGNYVTIFSNNRKLLYRKTMKEIMTLLPDNFVRVHRSYIVNSQKILKLEAIPSGDYNIHLSNNTLITLSRRYKNNLAAFF